LVSHDRYQIVETRLREREINSSLLLPLLRVAWVGSGNSLALAHLTRVSELVNVVIRVYSLIKEHHQAVGLPEGMINKILLNII